MRLLPSTRREVVLVAWKTALSTGGEFSGLKNIRRNIFHTGKYKSLHQIHLYTKFDSFNSASFNSRAQVTATQVDTRKAALTVDAQPFFFASSVPSAGESQSSYSCTREGPQLDPTGPDPSHLDPLLMTAGHLGSAMVRHPGGQRLFHFTGPD